MTQEFHPVVQKIRQLLDDNNIEYTFMEHEEAISSEDAVRVRKNHTLSEGCKALIVKTDNGFVQVVIPGDKKFSNSNVRKICDTKDIRFANAEELEKLTDGVKPGGVPPFGNLFNLPVIVDTNVFNNEKIIFNCGMRTASISMKSEDYKNLIKPTIAVISS